MEVPVFEDGYCLTPEGLHFDAKSARAGMPRSFWETYSSFANTDGGIVALGLSEEGGKLKVTGVPDVRGTVQNLWNALNDKGKVSSNLLRDESVMTVEIGGKQAILIEVPRADCRDRPVFIDGNSRNTFRRQGDGDYKCSVDEIASMVSDALPTVTDRVPISSSEVADFDAETLKAYRNSFRTLKPNHPWNSKDEGLGDQEVGAPIGRGQVIPAVYGSKPKPRAPRPGC